MRLKLAALDLDDRAVRGQPIEVALYTREIISARRRLIGGFYAFDNVVKTTRIAGDCSRRRPTPRASPSAELDPGVSGEVIAVATTRDRDGNEARAVTSVYLAGDDDWWFGGDNGDRMDIIPDAKTYRAGDTAHVQVRMPFRKATALVTVEREGVLSSFVTELSGKDPVIDVKLRRRLCARRLHLGDGGARPGRRTGGCGSPNSRRRWNIALRSAEIANPTALGRSRQAELPDRDDQGEGRLGRPPAQGRA